MTPEIKVVKINICLIIPSERTHNYTYVSVYIYIYIYRERERERDVHTSVHRQITHVSMTSLDLPVNDHFVGVRVALARGASCGVLQRGVYVCVYIYIYIHISLSVSLSLSIYIYILTYTHVSLCLFLSLSLYIYIYTCHRGLR